MKLQRMKTREYNGKDYFRYSVNIPMDEVKALGWREGDELRSFRANSGGLTLAKASPEMQDTARTAVSYHMSAGRSTRKHGP